MAHISRKVAWPGPSNKHQNYTAFLNLGRDRDPADVILKICSQHVVKYTQFIGQF